MFRKLKGMRTGAVDVKNLKQSLRLLLIFILLAGMGFTDMFITYGGWLFPQLINNCLVGVLFLLFLYELKKSITDLRE